MTIENPSFIHLRTHSNYSLARGVIKIPKLIEACTKQCMPAVALTDRGNMFGALEFSEYASKNGLQPIVGVVVQLAEHRPTLHQSLHTLETGDLVLLAQNKTGYHHLLKLVSQSFVGGEDPQNPVIFLDELIGKTDGLIALTGGTDGGLSKHLLANNHSAAEGLLTQLNALFPNRLYIELHRHFDVKDNDYARKQRAVEPHLLALADAHHLPLVATNDAYFLTPELFEAQDVLMCIGTGRYYGEEDREHVSAEHYFKSAEQMAALFADIPEAITNTIQIAKRCAVMSEGSKPMLPDFPTQAGRTQEDEFRAVATAGLEVRLARRGLSNEDTKPYLERLKYEMDVIVKMGFPGYFLIVSDFIRWSKEQGIPVGPGRGSGAGSVVAWAMNITDLDPLQFGLLFERFLNPERVSMPDFDIDFCQYRRDEVIAYVQQKYGKDHVAQIITFGTLQARAVIRDVARVLQMPYSQADAICKMIPNNPANPVTLQQAIDMDAELRRMQQNDQQVAKLMDIALKLEGMTRHAGTHAAGLVIGSKPLDEILPLYSDPRSPLPVTQYPMKYSEAAGLVKFDFLGLKTLTQIQQCCALIQQHTPDFDIQTAPFDDPATFAMLARGESTGVFQMESAGMRDALRKMKPDTLEDIIALISLYRPGPMENIPTYIARKHGLEQPNYLHPSLEPVLKETYGVIIYQEQVMEIAKVLSGYSLGGADLLRRAMGKKIKAEMEQQRALFVEGAVNNNVDAKLAGDIFDLVEKFAGYGFNKSHAAAYAVIGYHTAYLKANYPVEFLTACLNIEIDDTDKLFLFCDEAERCGITMLLPDINQSQALFSVERTDETKHIRYGLGGLKGVGVVAMQALVEARNAAGGTFTDLFHFARSCDARVLNKRQLEGLAKAGAFDSLHPNRHQVHEATALLTRYGQNHAEEIASQQINLFGGGDNNVSAPLPALPDVADWDELERLTQERDAVGFYLSSHPLDAYKDALRTLGVVSQAALNERIQSILLHEGKVQNLRQKLAGVMSSFKIRSSPRGRYAFLQLTDASGVLEVSVFNEQMITDKRDIIQSGRPLLVEVDIRADEGGMRLQAESIILLDDAIANQQHITAIHLHANTDITALKQTISNLPKGRAQLRLHIPTLEQLEVLVMLKEGVSLTPQHIRQLQQVPGVLDVNVAA